MVQEKFKFKVGTFKFHENPNFNYQLNRIYGLCNVDINEIKNFAKKVNNAETWEKEMLKMADKAFVENRIEQAIIYYRMAEFFMYDGNPDKIKVYEKSINLFYDYYSDLFKQGILTKDSVPFESAYLPVIYGKPEKEKCHGTIVMFGGFDSYMEEFLNTALYFRQNGFAVYLFEGPGQGGVMRKYHLPFIAEYEKPVKAVLDHYDLNDVTLIGISLGAVLAPRVAAFENRVKKVVAWCVVTNTLDSFIATRPKNLQKFFKFMMRNRWKGLINFILKMNAKKESMVEWALNHGMYNFGVNTIYDFLKKADSLQYINVGDKITQDFLLLGASHDHLVQVEGYKAAIDCLKNVRSLTYRLFTEKENAENHCNIGNLKLALDTIISWIKLLSN